MRLLFVSLNFAPELTATGKYTGDMAEWFAARGHDVEAIAGLPHYPEWTVASAYQRSGFKRERSHGIFVFRTPHTVPNPKRVSGMSRVFMECTFSLNSLYWWVRIFLRRQRYDAVIAICPPMQDAMIPWLYGIIRNVPTVLHIQDFQVDAAIRLKMLTVGPLERWLYSIENFLLRRSIRVSTITSRMGQRAVQKGVDPKRLWLVPNWADVSTITPGQRNNAFREDLGIDSDRLLVMYAGAMGKKQGLDVLLEAANHLRSDDRFHFALVGSGADQDRLLDQAREMTLENVQFLPVQPRERLRDMLAAADIHLAIQRRDAADLVMPSKLANILAAGRPTIATADEGTALWDVLEGHNIGCCVPPENAMALAQAVLELGRNREACERMGSKARAYAERHLDQDLILGRFERQLMELVGCVN